jgi:hypothetical protein
MESHLEHFRFFGPKRRQKYSMYGIDFPRAFGTVEKRPNLVNVEQPPTEIIVSKWLRSIEHGFAQAENNHFKPLFRGARLEPRSCHIPARGSVVRRAVRSMAAECLGQE